MATDSREMRSRCGTTRRRLLQPVQTSMAMSRIGSEMPHGADLVFFRLALASSVLLGLLVGVAGKWFGLSTAFDLVLDPVISHFSPDLVLVAAGFDAAEGDPLGGCNVTPEGYAAMTQRLMKYADGRVVLALEGGITAECVAACVTALLDNPAVDVPEEEEEEFPSHPWPMGETGKVLKRVVEVHQEHWPVLLAPGPFDMQWDEYLLQIKMCNGVRVRSHVPNTAATQPRNVESERSCEPTSVVAGPCMLAGVRCYVPTRVLTRSSILASHRMSRSVRAFSSIGERPWALTLERSLAKDLSKYFELAGTGSFEAEVVPDLPIATTWGGLAKAISSSVNPKQASQAKPTPIALAKIPNKTVSSAYPSVNPKQASQAKPTPIAPESVPTLQGMPRVLTVGANLKSLDFLRERIIRRACDGTSGSTAASPDEQHPPPVALLMVSGTHPVRQIPGVSLMLRSSLDTLKLASELKLRGDIPSTTQLWAVANPNIEKDASLLEKKVAAGATTILTQPPFDMEACEKWTADAKRRGLIATSDSPEGARLLMGAPIISSPGQLAFWISLANCGFNRASRELLQRFMEVDTSALSSTGKGSSETAMEEFCYNYNREAVKQAVGSKDEGGR
eukprot:gene23872-9442_t